jgi:hypothetical protein
MAPTNLTGTILRAAAAIAVAASTAGCEWLARRESISCQAGDAIAWNKAVHTVDPWPAGSGNTTIPVSGRRVAAAVGRYENGAYDGAGKGAPAASSGASIDPPELN